MKEVDEAYLTHVKVLDRFYRSNMNDWSILWPPRQPSNPVLLLTHIDVEQDPIIGALQTWIARGATEPVPTYPVPGVVDPRPIEIVPSSLKQIDPDVWDHLRRARIDVVCNRFVNAYTQSHDKPIEAAEAPSDERLRQFRRLTSQYGDELTWKQICDCLGWHTVINDTLVVKAVTEALMRISDRQGGPVSASMWYTKRGTSTLWKFDVCMWEMRVAAVFISRLRMGGAEFPFLARDIHSCMPVLMEGTALLRSSL
jgi:hypothetical protein